MSEEEVEQHLWRLVLLVRCQDRQRGLRLQRHEPQRKLLDLRLYELLLLYMRLIFMKEKVVQVDVVNKGTGELRLKFMDVGKWSGHNFGEPPNAFAASMNPSSNKNADAANFARITKEFQKMKRDRLEGNASSKQGRAVAHGRAKMRESNGGGAMAQMLNPMGHSYALNAVSKKEGGYQYTSQVGNGMLDSLYSDRRDFF